MNKPLRNTHRHVWLLLALLLPAAIVCSWLVIPNAVPVKLIAAAHTKQLPHIAGQKETRQYCLRIRTNKERTEWQLEWVNKQALTVPSALIYQKTKLVGRIESRGNYLFPVELKPGDKLELTVYDFIHQKIVDSINLTI